MSDPDTLEAIEPAPRLRHPRGLRVLFLTEMWERFSFYGLAALLPIYLTEAAATGGLEWSTEQAGLLLAWYGGLVYFTPIIGGYIADRWLGTSRSLIVGGLIIAAGHFTLAVESLPTLAIGLILVIIGTGFFKSNVSTMVGQLYQQGDQRRDAGFTIFYMGINLGGTLAPIVCGLLRTLLGWNWGFAAAGVGMLLGLAQYLHGRPRHLAGIGAPPAGSRDLRPLTIGAAFLALLGIAGLALGLYDGFASLGRAWSAFAAHAALVTLVSIGAAVAVVSAVGIFIWRQEPEDRGPVAAIFLMAFFVTTFWTGFFQSSTSVAFFANRHVDRGLPEWLRWSAGGQETFPAEWFQSVNPFLILALAPVFASLWLRLARRRNEPRPAAKMGLGLVLLGLGFLFMVGAASSMDGGMAAPWWLVAMFFVVTCGELCVSPVGLSLVSRLAPARFASMLMGVWFLAIFAGGFLAGMFSRTLDAFEPAPHADGSPVSHFILEGLPGFYLFFVLAPIVAGLTVLALSPLFRKLMRGRA
jgi:POT family proton-dependent oligopeptide transporter